LARLVIENFRTFEGAVASAVRESGPTV